MDNYIRIYPWEEAPEELRLLSECGGDEDFILVIPPHMWDGFLPSEDADEAPQPRLNHWWIWGLFPSNKIAPDFYEHEGHLVAISSHA